MGDQHTADVKKPVRVGLPKITAYPEYLKICILLYKNECELPAIIIRRCKCTDHFGRVYESDSAFTPGGGVTHPAMLTMNVLPNTYFEGATFEFELLTSLGKKVYTTFLCENHKTLACKYQRSSVSDMNEEECTYFVDVMNATVQKTKADAEEEKKYARDDSKKISAVPGLDQYLDALHQEMRYLRDNGGRQYKVVNGQYISKNNGMYAYSFELESEAHIADDSPVSVTCSNGSASGSVLQTDGFNLILLLDRSIGLRISAAYIKAEPWKLLERLHDKLGQVSSSRKIMKKLVEEGPHLSVACNLSDIPKGQEAAKQHAKDDDITIIWGPPGTGKTYTMSEIALYFLSKQKKILIVSHSNISVDGVILKIKEQLQQRHMEDFLEDGSVLRYGYIRDERLAEDKEVAAYHYALERSPVLKASINQLQQELDDLGGETQEIKEKRIEIIKQLKGVRAQVKEREKHYAGQAQLVATTISKVYADALFEDRTYDVVMFDEISMAYIPQIFYAAACANERLICVGDFRQLAPIVQSKAKNLLGKDLFSFLGISDGSERIYGHPWLVMLNEQYRMHPQISAFANLAVYANLLKDHDGVKDNRAEIVGGLPFSGSATNLIDLTGTYCATAKNSDHSRFNILSAVIAFSAAETAVQNGEESVGIITPYAAQARLIKAIIRDEDRQNQIVCSTVHQFQGSERNLIIFDAVESYPSTKPGWLLSKNENGSVMRLINVAVTRARGKLILVANRGYWENKYADSQHTLFKLIREIHRTGRTTGVKDGSLKKYLNEASYGNTIKTYLKKDTMFDLLLKEIRKATEEILISFPGAAGFGLDEEKLAEQLEQAAERGVQVKVKCTSMQGLPHRWQKISKETENAVFPLIAVDRKSLWYGIPMEEGFFRDGLKGYKMVCPIFCRLSGKSAVEVVLALSELDVRTINGLKTELYAAESNNPKNNSGGLSKFIAETQICRNCGSPLNLVQSRNRKTFMKCTKCDYMEYLTADEMNEYIEKYDIRCPKCGSKVKGRIGIYGPYIQCENRHCFNPKEI